MIPILITGITISGGGGGGPIVYTGTFSTPDAFWFDFSATQSYGYTSNVNTMTQSYVDALGYNSDVFIRCYDFSGNNRHLTFGTSSQIYSIVDTLTTNKVGSVEGLVSISGSSSNVYIHSSASTIISSCWYGTGVLNMEYSSFTSSNNHKVSQGYNKTISNSSGSYIVSSWYDTTNPVPLERVGITNTGVGNGDKIITTTQSSSATGSIHISGVTQSLSYSSNSYNQDSGNSISIYSSIFGYPYGNSFRLKEIMVWKRVLTDYEIYQVESYLSAKWQVPVI